MDRRSAAALVFCTFAIAARAYGADRVAVMPFKALTTQKTWIGAGLAEALTNALAAVPSLHVAERSQLRAVQDELRVAEKDLDSDDGAIKIGKLVSANRLVLGSFQIAGDEILVNGRFVTTETGVIGKTFQIRGKVDSIFDLYSKLTDQVLGLLGVRVQGKTQLVVAAVQAAPSSEAAQQLYVEGREAFHQRTPDGYRRAIELLTRATHEDPSYALAFAALAEAQAELVGVECQPLSFLRVESKAQPLCHIPFE